jgi:hypothetical protein
MECNLLVVHPCYKESHHIGRLALALLLLVLISNYLVAFAQVLQEVQTYVSCMKINIPKKC